LGVHEAKRLRAFLKQHAVQVLNVAGPLPSEEKFGSGAVFQHSQTPSLRAAGFEDDDEDENEAPGELKRALFTVWRGPEDLIRLRWIRDGTPTQIKRRNKTG
jgi:hypothetical protein